MSVDKMIWKLAWESHAKLPGPLMASVDPEDLHQEAAMSVWEVIGKWSPDKGKFTTYAHTVARNALISWHQKMTAKKRYSGYTVEVDSEVLETRVGLVEDGRDPLVDPVLAEWFGSDTPKRPADPVLAQWGGQYGPADRSG